tara:strand:+ start:260 stop:511 length:252 start_codon:yes stop_codon:yes gene_type:complete
MRTAGAGAKTNKYRCEIEVMGEIVLCDDYATLKVIADETEIPYHTIADVFEGRRTSFMKYSNTKYFPNLRITKLSDIQQNEVS